MRKMKIKGKKTIKEEAVNLFFMQYKDERKYNDMIKIMNDVDYYNNFSRADMSNKQNIKIESNSCPFQRMS